MTFAARNIGSAAGYFAGTLTAGVSGFSGGFLAATYGTLSPTGALGGTITDWRANTNTLFDVIKITVTPDPGQAAFTTASVSLLGSNTSASANYTYSGGVATWQWAGGSWSSSGFTNTVVYQVALL